MENSESKKLLVLRILELLTEYSDCDHKLRQGEIIRLLNVRYGIECERKAVARNISFLKEAGYDVVSDSDGVYLSDRKFEAGELRLLIDSVLSNRHICKEHTLQLISKLTKEGGKYFKNSVRHVLSLDDWQKEDGQELFLTIEMMSEAIEQKRQVSFIYLEYGVDKKMHPRRPYAYTVNPFQLILKNGNYYLICNFDGHENLAYLRLDRMTKIEISEKPARDRTTIKGFEHGFSLGQMSNRLPYFYYDDPQRIVFETCNGATEMLNHVFNWFGRDVNVVELPTGEYRFSLIASPEAMRYWILQFGKHVKVISPESLLNTVRSDIAEMQKLYEDA